MFMPFMVCIPQIARINACSVDSFCVTLDSIWQIFNHMKQKHRNINFSQLCENLTILMEHCEIDGANLARETGLPTSTISRLRSNASDFSPNISSLIPIARYFEITVSQLIGEEALPQDICGSFTPSINKRTLIPLLNNENIHSYIINKKISNDVYIEVDSWISNKSFAWIVQGSAMEPKFSDNSVLIIDTELNAENHDYVLVICSETKGIIFRQLVTDGDNQYLFALNPIFKNLVKINEHSHKIIGVLVQLRQNFKKIISHSTA